MGTVKGDELQGKQLKYLKDFSNCCLLFNLTLFSSSDQHVW